MILLKLLSHAKKLEGLEFQIIGEIDEKGEFKKMPEIAAGEEHF